MSLQALDRGPGPHSTDGIRPFAVAYLVLLAVQLLVVATGTSATRTALQAVPADVPVVSLLGDHRVWTVLGMVAVGALVANRVGPGVQRGLPRDDALSTLALVVVGPLLVWLGLLAVAALGLGSGLTPTTHSGRFSVAYLWQAGLRPALLVGLAYGVLFSGAIQPVFRERFGGTAAVLAVTALAGFSHWIVRPLSVVDPLRGGWAGLVLVAVQLGLIVSTGAAVVVLSRMRTAESLTDALTPGRLLVLLLGSGLFVVLATDALSGALGPAHLLRGLGWLGVFAVAAVGYERGRSVWLPVLAIAVFDAAIRLTPYVEAVVGLPAP